jgi:PAS domain S-box-containing protein
MPGFSFGVRKGMHLDRVAVREGVDGRLDSGTVLLIGGTPADARMLREALADRPRWRLEAVDSLRAALERLATDQISIALLDSDLPESTGLDTVATVLRARPDLPLVVLTRAPKDHQKCIEAVRLGAQDCLTRDQIDANALHLALMCALQRTRLTRNLRRSELQTEAILRALPDLIFQMGADGTITGFNGNEGAPLLRRPEQFLGQQLDDVLPPELAETTRHHIEQALRTGQVQLFEYGIEIDGARRQFEARMTAHGEDGVLTVVRDVTERRAAQEALRKSEQHYRRLFERNLAGVFRSSIDGHFLEANQALARIFGFSSREELLAGTTWQIYESPEDRSELLSLLEREGTLVNHEQRLCRRDGEPVWVLINLSLVHDRAGNPVLDGTMIDITARKRMEEQLLRSQKLQAVGQLAGGIAHDFNNLLQAMQSGLEVLRSKGSDSARGQSVLADLEGHVDRGSALTRKLLLFARREIVKRQRLDLNSVIRETDQLLRRLVRENIHVVLRLAEHELPVEADPGQLEQVLINLTLNASEAMPVGGRLVIETHRQGRQAICLFTDTGVGLNEEQRSRVFDPFYTTKAPDKGTGLGLTVVHGIVTQLGGGIEVDSQEDRGSTFKIELPLTTTAAAALSDGPPAEETPVLAGHRVLVVEDELGAREGLKDILDLLGYQATAVATGEEALALPEQPVYDVLLTDLVLPGIQGFEVAERLKRRWPELQVIAMSGYTEDETVRQQVWSGAVRFLQKPFGAKQLAAELRRTGPNGDNSA